MAKTSKQDKDKIIGEFETMKSYELSARDLYAQIAADRRVNEQRVKDVFTNLAADEQRHADLVQEIIDLVNDTL